MAYYEFGGIVIKPRFEEFMPQVFPAENLYSLRHIPYSDANVLDLGGKGVRKYGPIDIRIDPDDASALEALSQQTDELIVAGITYPTAILISLTNKRMTPRNEWIYYTAEWVIG